MRIALLGNSGSGKSTLAAALAAEFALPSLDLDTVAWEPAQPATPRDDRLAREDVRAFCRSHRHWVVEGCYATLIEAALALEPHLVFLNPGLERCLAHCRARAWEPHKYPSPEAQDAQLPFLLSWVADYYARTGPLSLSGHAECFAAYSGPKRQLVSLPALPLADAELLEWLASGSGAALG